MRRIGFIGGGNMASAIIGGIVRSGMEVSLQVYDLDSEKLTYLKRKYGIIPVGGIAELVKEADYLFLAVKPQNFPEVLADMRGRVFSDAVIISIAAGITPGYISDALGYSAKVVQVMPNTPLLLGYGASALSRSPGVNDEEFAYVRQIFDGAGITAVIPNQKMNEVIAINGSTPAFLYRYAQCYIEYGKSVGLEEDACLKLFAQTMIGSAKMMLDSGYSLDELITMVSSKGGTTIAGLEALERGRLFETVQSCCESTVKRAYELSK